MAAGLREDLELIYVAEGKWTARRTETVVLSLVGYYAVGCAYFRFASPLRLDVLDSAYFITVSVTTVGYGDVVPHTAADKLFTIAFVMFGLIIVFHSIADGMSALLEAATVQAKKQQTPGFFVAYAQTRDVHSPGSSISMIEEPSEWRGSCRSVGWALAIACTMLSGGAVVSCMEQISFVDGLFWAFQTATTVGYGDLVLKSRGLKVFALFYAFVAVILLAYASARLLAANADVAFERRRAALLKARLDNGLITSLDRTGRGVDRAEFVVGMLRILGHVTDEDAAPWFERFAELDADGNGRLDAADLAAMAVQDGAQAARALGRLSCARADHVPRPRACVAPRADVAFSLDSANTEAIHSPLLSHTPLVEQDLVCELETPQSCYSRSSTV